MRSLQFDNFVCSTCRGRRNADCRCEPSCRTSFIFAKNTERTIARSHGISSLKMLATSMLQSIRVNLLAVVIIRCNMQWSDSGERGGTAFPFRFRRGNAVPLVYTTAEGGCRQNCNLKWLWLVGMYCNHKMHKIWSVNSQENYKNIVATMWDFKDKMHQIVCRRGLRLRPRCGSLQRSPIPHTWILAAYFEVSKGERRKGKGGRRGYGKRKAEGGEGKVERAFPFIWFFNLTTGNVWTFLNL